LHNRREGHSIWYTHGRVSADYTTVGHVTADVMADGSRRPGGGAFYSALQAARLGRRARILTRGRREEIEELLAPYDGELELEVIDAPQTTTLATSGIGATRSQRLLAWGGEIGAEIELDTEILHLAPVARETPSSWRGRAAFVGLTPQGLVRSWSREDALIVPCPLRRSQLPQHCDAIVISEAERMSCSTLFAREHERRSADVGADGRAGADADSADADGRTGADARTEAATGAVIAVTAGAAPTELRLAGGEIVHSQVPPIGRVCDDLGAGDVFAAAFFIAFADGATARAAAAFANAAAAVRVAGHGAGAIGDRAAIEARMAAVA
jgi:1D-myo-inositol 3-kinase